MSIFESLQYSKRSTTLDAAGLPKTQHTTFRFRSSDDLVHLVKIGYEYNENAPDCIENQLLRSFQYTDSQKKTEYLASQLLHILPSIPNLYSTATGIKIYTEHNGVVGHDVFEDTSDIPTLVDVQSLPAHLRRIKADEISNHEPLTWCVSKVKYQNHTCVLKQHVTPGQNHTFQAELDVYTCSTLQSPHIARFLGCTSNENSRVTGIVLEFYEGGNLKYLLRKARAGYQDDILFKWAAQIAHALVALHQSGFTHGDLRCENIVIDREGNIKVIDIVRGWGYMDGWAPVSEKDNLSDPKWDIYSLGVTLWEMAHGGQDPPSEIVLQLEQPTCSSYFWEKTAGIVKKCLITDPEHRPSAMEILTELRVGLMKSCGCGNTEILA
jgi:hypothetical protein